MGRKRFPFAAVCTALLVALNECLRVVADGAVANACEPFVLGGADVRVPLDFPNADLYASTLWRKQVGNRTFTATPYRHMKSRKVGVFGFEYRFGHVRGIGVKGGYDREITGQQGILVDFSDAPLSRVSVGVRALFVEEMVEMGRWKARRNGAVVDEGVFAADTREEEDGRHRFNIYVDGDGFDELEFMVEGSGSDYFLEYVEGCVATTFVPIEAEQKYDLTTSWTGERYNFHGACDLVLLKNPDFLGGLGLDIHIRTKLMNTVAYTNSAVLRIGYETFEVQALESANFAYWINGEKGGELRKGIAGRPIIYRQINAHDCDFVLDFDRHAVVFKKHNKLLRVYIEGATTSTFGNSLGLIGSYGNGSSVARDKETIIEDGDVFGKEWQVLATEPMIFHSIEGPQSPEACTMPPPQTLRRRSFETSVSPEHAVRACENATEQTEFVFCAFDVQALNDVGLAKTQ